MNLHELEAEIAEAAALLPQPETPESFYTKVTPIPGLGNTEGHEILTRMAMSGLPLSPADQSAVEMGVIRPDRGGRSYWNFPRAAIGSFKAPAQAAHALRASPATTPQEALRTIRHRFAGLHFTALRAGSRQAALEFIGEALNLLQDSFSAAHVDRIGGTGAIRRIRAFYLGVFPPRRSTAPHEHNAPKDDRDDIRSGGALRREALAAVRWSRVYLMMALRHLRAPGSPLNASELQRFIGRVFASAMPAAFTGEMEDFLGEVPRSGQATVRWSGPYSTAGAKAAGQGKRGQYVIEFRGGGGGWRPIYNGISGDGNMDLAARIAAHSRNWYNSGNSISDYRVFLGIMPGYSTARAKAVEHSIRRDYNTRPEVIADRSLQMRGRAPKGRLVVAKDKDLRIVHHGKGGADGRQGMPAHLRGLVRKTNGVQRMPRGSSKESAAMESASAELQAEMLG